MAAEAAAPRSSSLPALIAAAETFLSGLVTRRHLLVALSGGADSRALLLALSACRAAFPDLDLSAATVDHGLRAASRSEAEDAGRFAESLGIPHRILAWTGDKPATGLQAAARHARYRLLVEAAEAVGASAILTGHHADDQAETLAMRAARSRHGVTGMAPATLAFGRIWVCRPCLGLPKTTLAEALVEAGYGWSEDPSNRDPRFERARLRATPLASVPADGAAARHALALAVARLLSTHVRIAAGAVAIVSPEIFEDAAGQRALHLLAGVIGGQPHPPSAETAARLAAHLATGMPGRITARRTLFDRRREALYLYREARDLAAGDSAGAVAALVEDGLPPALARRAAPAYAALGPPREIAPFAAFLPLFEQPAAEALVSLFGHAALPPCPIQAAHLWKSSPSRR